MDAAELLACPLEGAGQKHPSYVLSVCHLLLTKRPLCGFSTSAEDFSAHIDADGLRIGSWISVLPSSFVIFAYGSETWG